MSILPKDIYEYLTRFADDKTIVNMLLVNKQFRDPVFFKRVIERRYPLLIRFKPKEENWREFYLKIVKYNDLLQREFGIEYIPNPKYNPIVFYEITQTDKKHFTDLEKHHRHELNRFMYYAAEIGDLNTVERMISGGADDIKTALIYAFVNKGRNSLDVIKYFIDKLGGPENISPKRLVDAFDFAAIENNLPGLKYLDNILIERGLSTERFYRTALGYAEHNATSPELQAYLRSRF